MYSFPIKENQHLSSNRGIAAIAAAAEIFTDLLVSHLLLGVWISAHSITTAIFSSFLFPPPPFFFDFSFISDHLMDLYLSQGVTLLSVT